MNQNNPLNEKQDDEGGLAFDVPIKNPVLISVFRDSGDLRSQQDRKVCKRCGQCCTYEIDGIIKRCRFLIGSKITSCRIYKDPKRIGREIDEGMFCNPRALDNRIFKGCPFNVA